ncbi:MAG: DUF222 domain-containing protein [Acidimicrobiales bacterium]|nr:DUF222 domain-containing protein [Acidimicrobiales bacterium]
MEMASENTGRSEPEAGRAARLIADARAAVAALSEVDLGAFADAALSEHVADLQALAADAFAASVGSLGSWDARALWADEGFRSAKTWVASKGRTSSPDAGRQLRLARFLASFDHTAAAVQDGSVPVESAQVMARAAVGARQALFARDEALLVDQAQRLTVDEFAVVVRRWTVLADDALADAEADAAFERRGTRIADVGDMTHLDASFDRSDGAIAHAALEAAMGLPGAGDVRTIWQRRTDALVDIFRAYLDGADLPTPTGGGPATTAPRASVSVRVDLDVLTGSSDDPFDPSWWDDVFRVGPVGRSTLRRFLCDSWLSRVVTSGRDLPLGLGASSRFFTDGQRQALIARDGSTCVAPGCTVPADRCHAHHVDPFEHGGATDVCNGVHLCSFHHHKVHEGHWELVRLADGSWDLIPPWAAARAASARSSGRPPPIGSG